MIKLFLVIQHLVAIQNSFIQSFNIKKMKHLIILISLFIAPTIVFSQSKAIKQFYNKYRNLESVTDIKLNGWVLKLASTFTEEEDAEKILKKITQLRVLVMEEGNLVSKEEYKSLVKSVKKDDFAELFKVKEEGQNIEFMIREDKDTITDVLILVNGIDQFVLLSLEGKLKFSDLNDLNIEVDGGEHFQKIPEHKEDVPRA